MAFKKRNIDRRKLDAPIFSGAAEVCETRALLSADGVCLPAVDADAVVIEDIEATDSEEVVDVDATVGDGEFIPELAICTMMPMVEGEVFEDLGGGDGTEVIDPSLMYYSSMPFDGEQIPYCDVVVDDGTVIDEEPVFKGEVEEEAVIDGEVTFEDFDPSWVIRSFGAPSGEVVDDLAFTCGFADGEVPEDGTDNGVKVQFWHDLAPGSEEDIVDETDGNVDITTLEDYDPSWAYRGGIAKDGELCDEESEDGEVTVDGELVEKEVDDFDPEVVLEDGEVPIRYYFGMNFRGNTGGEVPVEVLAMSSGAPTGDAIPSVMGPVAISTPAVAPVVNIPVVVNQPSVISTVVPPSLSIPVNQGGSSSLFGKEEELLVTTLAPVVSEIEPLVADVEDSVSSGLDSGFGELIGSSSDSSDAPVGELTPIFEEEQDEEDSVEVPAAEDVPVETEDFVGSVEAPQQPVVLASRGNYGRSIDEFMSEFAMSGFSG